MTLAYDHLEIRHTAADGTVTERRCRVDARLVNDPGLLADPLLCIGESALRDIVRENARMRAEDIRAFTEEHAQRPYLAWVEWPDGVDELSFLFPVEQSDGD